MKLPSPLVLLAVLVTLLVAACSHPPAFFAVAAPVATPSACSPTASADRAFTPLDIETAVYTADGAVGDTLSLTLDDHPTTGFVWEVVSLPPQITLAGQERLAARGAEPREGSGRVGEPGVVRYRFAAVQPGQGVVVLAFRRPWETDKAPARVVVAHVAVR